MLGLNISHAYDVRVASVQIRAVEHGAIEGQHELRSFSLQLLCPSLPPAGLRHGPHRELLVSTGAASALRTLRCLGINDE